MQINEFEYGGIASGTFGITCGTERHFILPEKRKYVQEVIGMDGVVDFGIPGYGVRVITMPLYFEGDYADLRANRERIIAWLSNDGRAKHLIFGNEPDKYYKAKIYAALDLENSSDSKIGDIQFECNPPWQFLVDGTALTPAQITWVNAEIAENQYIKEFSAPGNIRFVNNGAPLKPIIKVIGYMESGTVLTYAGKSLQINTDVLWDGFAVNCKDETVTRLSDGENLYPYIDAEKNHFFELASGNVEISVDSPGLAPYPYDLTIIVDISETRAGY